MTKIIDLLPIGSVVLLKNSEKKLMIYGIKQTSSEDNKDYDYMGVIYPEGYIGSEYQFLFNHEDIQEVFFKGFVNEERTEFIEKLDEFYK